MYEIISFIRYPGFNYVKTKAKYPIWSLKYHLDYKNLSVPIDELLKLIHNSTNEIDVKLISGVLEKMKDFRYELKLALKTISLAKAFISTPLNI